LWVPSRQRTPDCQAVLVEQLEVEERADVRLAAREQERIADLARLVAYPRLGVFRRDRLDDEAKSWPRSRSPRRGRGRA